MAKQRKRWIIKDSEGRISGPFPTEKVLYKIGRGEIGGEESIAVYPGGDWFPISQEPQFYDRLIEVLAGSGEGDSSTFDEYTPVSEQQPKSKAKTVVFGTEDGLTPTGDLPPGGESPKRGKVRREKAEDDPIQKNKKPADEQKKDRRNKARSGPDSVIELMDMGHLIKKERVKRLKLPIFIAVIVVVVGIMSQMGKKQGETGFTSLQSRPPPRRSPANS